MSDAVGRLTAALADRYRIERELGQGGMATVYLAEDLKHRRPVAIKVLRPDLAASLGPDRFMQEIDIAARLQHPHILPVHDSGEAGGFLFYVMPYVDGESLRERLTNHGELPVHDAVRLLVEITDALAYAHSHGVVHRDIKPENIMLSGRHALVTDFGVAKAVSEASGRNRLTTAGVALGTPAYMAPEQASADPNLDQRVDIYALGVLGYELLAGRPPFVGGTPQQVLAAHVTTAPEPVTTHRTTVSPALGSVIMRALEKRPADRWQTADELLAQLEPLATPSGGLTPTQMRPAVPGRGGRRWMLWGLGGVALAATAVAVTLLVSRRPPTLVLGKRVAIAAGPELETWPSLSGDGKLLAYTSRGGDGWSVQVRQVDGGTPVSITGREPGSVGFGVLSPDGTRLLVTTPAGIQVVPSLGGQMRLVADLGAGQPADQSFPANPYALWAATWSPDGARVAYTSLDTLYVQSIDGSSRTALATGTWVHSPAWSDDGWIAYVEGNTNFHTEGNLAPSQLRLVRASGGTPIDLTGRGTLNTSPVWVPERRALLFISDRDGGRDIYELFLTRSGQPSGPPVRVTTGLNPERLAISADGKWLAWSVYTETANIWSLPVPARDSVSIRHATPVTQGAQVIENMSVSRDGVWLYYDSDRSGVANIWRQRIVGGPPEQLTDDSVANFAPGVSPSGNEVAFHSFRTGNRDIFVIPSSGGPARQVTTSPTHDWNARWMDDSTLVFDEQTSADSSIWTARRHPDGSWGPPKPILVPGVSNIANIRPSPDGRWLGVITLSGVGVIDLRTMAYRQVVPVVAYVAWSADSRTLYLGTAADASGHWKIVAASPEGGPIRTVAYGNDPITEGRRFGLEFSGGRLYVPLVERKGDIWVAEVRER